ncbi:cytosolic sulfotransferase 15-like [Oryza brachyantha]|uniref:Sulfotransferase n=1 Tax=Oryza brachyantha TaxID=4533 RepID=J3MVX2_ORYBR|nr:cytosolic sulfotransferase 15-like [Oryza brachyantha]
MNNVQAPETKQEDSPENSMAATLLPTREGWSTPLTLYNNCWLRSHMVDSFMAVRDNFKPRHDDVILATHPKSGTTWLKAMAFAIVNRSRYDLLADGDGNPLRAQNPQRLVPFIGVPGHGGGDLAAIEAMPSPRLLATHLPLSLLPPAVTAATGGCRVVYLCREPKDSFVSRWHFDNKMVKGSQTGAHAIELDAAFAMFCEGCTPFGPFWEHYLQYWRESLRRPREVLFLRYEELVADPLRVVRDLAAFLGVPFIDEEESNGVDREVVRLCSFETLSGFDVNKNGGVERAGGKIFIGYSSLFRRGKTGDWVNHMSADMAEKLDALVREKFKGSGLEF